MADILKDTLSSVNDVQILKLQIQNHAGVKVDCTELWIDIEIYESIHNNVLTGSVTIHDTVNLIRNTPIIGKEKVYITFKTPSVDSTVKRFSVYDMSVKERIPGKQDAIFTLQFASRQYELDYNRRISKSFTNTKLSTVAKKVFDNFLVDKDDDGSVPQNSFKVTEDTGRPTNIVIPNWTPFQTLNWLAEKCDYYENYDYMFFETLDNFYFTPLSLLKTKPAVATYKYTSEAIKEDSLRNVNEEMKKIVTYSEVQNGCKKAEMEMEGTFTSLGVTYDMTYKKINYNLFSYIQDFQNSNTGRLSTQPMVPLTTVQKIAPQVKMIYRQKNSYNHNDIETQYNVLSCQKRFSHLLRNNAKVLKLEIAGDSRRRVGQVINVNIISAEFLRTKDDSSILDGHLSGRYLITAVGHHIGKNDGYHMGLEVVRDSFEEAYPDTVNVGN